MANKYMKLAIEKPEYLNCDSNRNLDFTTAYALLSAPDEVKQEVQAKQQLPHGEFGDWLKVNCRVTQRQAQKYMKLAIDMPELLNSNTKFTSHLKIEAAYALLSAPDEVKQEVQAKPLRCLTCKSLKSGIIQLSQNVITEENNGLGLKHLNQSSHNPDRYRH